LGPTQDTLHQASLQHHKKRKRKKKRRRKKKWKK
jgi:hypothetical protein